MCQNLPAGNAVTRSAIICQSPQLRARSGKTRLTKAHTKWRILHTERTKAESWDRANLSHTLLSFPTDTCCEIDFLEKSQLAHESLRLCIGIIPAKSASHPRRGIAWW